MDRHPMIAIFHLIIAIGLCSSARAFVAPPATTTPFSQRGGGVANTDASTPSSSTSLFDIAQQYEESKNVGLTLYPVISRIASKNWTGSCKYVGSDLVHLSKLKLTGGVRYDVVGRNVTLSSYLAFPNGNTREVVMTGGRDSSASSADSPVITLRSIAEDGGPIRMLLTEVGSDTILVNEVEEATGKTILTSSTSIVSDGNELVQVSHEVGEGGVAGIEGHQVWRLTEEAPRRVAPGKDADAARDALGKRERERAAEAAKSEVPMEFDDFEDFRDATGR